MKKEKPKPIAGVYIRSILLPDTKEMAYYIGSSKNLVRRRKDHKWRSGLPKILLEAYHEYGEKNFTWEEIVHIEDDITKKELVDIETEIIKIYDRFYKIKLLQKKGASKASRKRPFIHSGEKKTTKPKPHTGKNFKKEFMARKDFQKYKAVVCINKITGEEKTYETVTAAANALNINKFNIGSAANGRIKSAGGFLWKWE